MGALADGADSTNGCAGLSFFAIMPITTSKRPSSAAPAPAPTSGIGLPPVVTEAGSAYVTCASTTPVSGSLFSKLGIGGGRAADCARRAGEVFAELACQARGGEVRQRFGEVELLRDGDVRVADTALFRRVGILRCDRDALADCERVAVEHGACTARPGTREARSRRRQDDRRDGSPASDPGDPEQKRKIIGREFIRVFEQAAAEVVAEAGEHGERVDYLVQGTLYPDVVESGGGTGTANIKSHHNVGGLPADLQFELVEPLRTLFKDEVRAVGEQLGLPAQIVWRQPFPGPGLGIRIIGEVTRERLDVLREADAIASAELSAAGLDRSIWQCPVVLLADVRSVGVQGDGRTYGHPVVLRPVSSEDAMTADWSRLPYDVLERISTRITNEVARGQPGRARRDQQAPRHDRVGVAD